MNWHVDNAEDRERDAGNDKVLIKKKTTKS